MSLFKGRYRKLKYAGLILFLACACVATLGVLAYTSLISTAQYQLTGLKVIQKGPGLEVGWDDAGARRYEVFLQQDGTRPESIIVDENRCRIPLRVLNRPYRVTVTALNRFGGHSAAVSKNILTKKLPQRIETERDRYVGLEEKHRDLEADAHGKLRFESSDPSVVEVDSKGIMFFVGEGKANISIEVPEGDQYKAATKNIPVTVYPNELDTPQLKVSKKTDTTVTLSWDPVNFAKGYTLRKYDAGKGRYYDIMDFKRNTVSVQLPRDKAKYELQATAKVGGDLIESDASEEVKVKSTAASAEAYASAHDLATLDASNLELVAQVDGLGGASVPQSMSKVGDNYVITYVNHGGSEGALVTYSSDGQRIAEVGIAGMGHANGSTYSTITKQIYTVKTHREIKSASCTTYNPETGEMTDDFQLPRVASGIAYDETNGKYYLSKGNQVYVCDKDFNVESTIYKRARYHHTQDIGAYNGVALVCTWISGNQGYIDLYRVSDGAYIGSYNVPIGEIESCFVDNKHLIILMNNGTGGLGDCILRTAEPIRLP